MNLSEGVLRLRYRDSWEKPDADGARARSTVSPWRCSLSANLFRRGHRLRLDIAGSNFPHFDINPNSGEPEGSFEHPRIADIRVFAER